MLRQPEGGGELDILLLETLAPDARAWLEARYRVDFQPGLADQPSALRKAIYKTDALVVPPSVMINRDLLDFAPRLKVVGRVHDGTENIDIEACRQRRIRVVQAAQASVRAQAEYLLTALLTLYRRELGLSITPHRRADVRLGREIHDSVIGLFGLAPAAHTLATLLAPMGVRLIGYDPAIHHSATIWGRLGVQPVPLNELLATADAVSVQMLYASRFRGFINEHLLAHCKPGQLWAGISRASLFDTQALADALKDGRIDTCMLDSVDGRLTSPESPLAGLPNLLLTPQVSAHTRETRARGSWYLADRLHEALRVVGALAEHASRPMPLHAQAPAAAEPAGGAAEARISG